MSVTTIESPWQKKLEQERLVEVAAKIKETDKMLEFLGEYEYEKEVSQLRNDLQNGAVAMLTAGCRILRIREHEPHGTFATTLSHLNIEPRTAQRMMLSAVKFVEGDTGKVKYPQLVQNSTSKIYELAMLDDADLKDLEDGIPVADIKLDEIDKMSVRELKQKIRDSKDKNQSLSDIIAKKDQKINELMLKLEKAERRWSVDPADVKKFVETMTTEVQIVLADGVLLANKIRTFTKKITESLPSDETERSIYRGLFEVFKGSVMGARQEVARAEDELNMAVPESFAYMTDTQDEGVEVEL